MADNRLNKTGLRYFLSKLNSFFAKQTDLTALDAKVDEIISEGGEPNVIETIKVNNTALTPDAQKAVNIEIPEEVFVATYNVTSYTDISQALSEGKLIALKRSAESSPYMAISAADESTSCSIAILFGSGFRENYVVNSDNTWVREAPVPIIMEDNLGDVALSSMTNDGDGESPFATQDYVGENGGKIQKVKYDGTELTIDTTDKSVNVPKEVFAVTPNETTYQELDEALTAGKAISIISESSGGFPQYRSPLFIFKRGSTYPIEMVVQSGGNSTILSLYKVANNDTWTITEEYITMARASQIPTVVSQLTNDSNYQTDTEVQSAISEQIGKVYKPKGSTTFENLPALSATELGNVYNVTDAFTTTADFKEGAGIAVPAGSNVVIINDGTDESPVYKYDLFSGVVDLSDYWNQTNLPALTTAEIDEIWDSVFNPTTP